MLWSSLLARKSGISQITRFNPEGHRCRIAGEIKNFDPLPWIPKKETRRLDLFTQYALASAHQAIQDSGLCLDREDTTKIGVVFGSGMGGMTELAAQQEVIREKGPNGVSPFFIPKLMINAVSGEISIRYHLQGPNYVVAAACASSAQAIACAMRSIQWGETDTVITGGAEAILTSLSVAGFSAARALSSRNDEPEKASRPFDRERDGFVMGEGAGALVLEERDKAVARGARIYAEILGAAYNADAYHITQPDPEAGSIARVMEAALGDAGVSYTDISYINAHGTSTKQNDRTETLAVKKVFKEYAYKIPISSTKSMLGHLIGASGAIEAIVTSLSVCYNRIHPTANYEYADPECDLDYVPREARELPVNCAISNSFGFGGHNVCLVFGKH